MKHALVNLDNVVLDVAETPFEAHESLRWIECPDNVKLYWELVDGVFQDPHALTAEEKAELNLSILRRERDKKLVASDWTQAVDAPLTPEQKTAWQEYRQALRDITDTYSSIEDVVWPTKP